VSGFTVVVLFTALVGIVSAHHGRAGYAKELSTVTGTVTVVEWKNPHVFVNFDVKDATGKVTNWVGELSSPATMMAAGMTRTSLKPGDEIVVTGKAGYEGAPITLIDSIVKGGKNIVGDPKTPGSFTANTR
jgi:hydrogenase maturation factor